MEGPPTQIIWSTQKALLPIQMALRPIEEALYSTHTRGPLVDIGVPLEQGSAKGEACPLWG